MSRRLERDALHNLGRSPAGSATSTAWTHPRVFAAGPGTRRGDGRQRLAEVAAGRHVRAALDANGFVGDRKPSADDRKPFAKLVVGDRERRVREEVVPADDRIEALVAEELRERLHFRRRAV